MFLFGFSLCPLAVTRDYFLSLVSGIFNKVPSFTHFVSKKLLFLFGDFIPHEDCARFDFSLLLCNSDLAEILTVT